MKSLVTALLVLLPLTTATALETIRILDGKTAYCRNSQDQYRHRLGAYTLEAKSVSIQDEQIQLELNLRSLKCVQQEKKYGWVSADLFAATEFRSQIPGSPTITAIPNWAALRSYRDGIYVLLSEIQFDEFSNPTKLSIELSDFLTEDERQLLDDGQEIFVSLDSFLVKNISFTGASEDMRTNVSFGSYRVRFHIQQNDDGGYNAKML